MPKVAREITQRLTRGSQPARSRDGGARFQKRHQKVGGRKKGVQNLLTRELKQAIINGAIRHGEDGKGRNGLEGYMYFLASKDHKVFGMLLRAVLPMEVKASFDATVNVPYQSLEQAADDARRLGLPETRILEITEYGVDNPPDPEKKP